MTESFILFPYAYASVYLIFEKKAPLDEKSFTSNNVTLHLVSHARLKD